MDKSWPSFVLLPDRSRAPSRLNPAKGSIFPFIFLQVSVAMGGENARASLGGVFNVGGGTLNTFEFGGIWKISTTGWYLALVFGVD